MLSPAKINLILRIGGLRADGYHGLESLMLPVTYGDEISFQWRSSKTNKISLVTKGLKLTPEKNLAYRAAEGFSKVFDKTFELKIDLKKRIPTGAGLGGGSSNAASVLLFLARVYRIGLNPKLLRLARSLGADVPLFLHQTPAWCTGVGEICEPLRLPKFHFVLVLSRSTPMSTPLAYRELDKARGKAANRWPLAGMPDFLRTTEWSIPRLENDFEALVVGLKPQLRAVRSALAQARALAVGMSGSGSSFFGIYSDERSSRKAALWLNTRGFEAIACSSLSNWTK